MGSSESAEVVEPLGLRVALMSSSGENGNGNGWRSLLSVVGSVGALVGAVYVVLSSAISSQGASIHDLETRLREVEAGKAANSEKINEIETQFSQEARVRYLEIHALREASGLDPLPWMGDGTSRPNR
jgi:hypothetical protein